MAQNDLKAGAGIAGGDLYVHELETLYKISQLLAAGAGQKQTLAEVLDTLDSELGMNRGAVTLLSPDGDEISNRGGT